MRRGQPALVAALVLSMSPPALAGPYADEMARCLVRSTSPADRNALVRWLFAAGPMESAVGDDRVFVLSEESLKTSVKQNIRFFGRGLGADKMLRIYLTTRTMNPNAEAQPEVVWKNATIGQARRERTAPATSHRKATRPDSCWCSTSVAW